MTTPSLTLLLLPRDKRRSQRSCQCENHLRENLTLVRQHSETSAVESNKKSKTSSAVTSSESSSDDDDEEDEEGDEDMEKSETEGYSTPNGKDVSTVN